MKPITQSSLKCGPYMTIWPYLRTEPGRHQDLCCPRIVTPWPSPDEASGTIWCPVPGGAIPTLARHNVHTMFPRFHHSQITSSHLQHQWALQVKKKLNASSCHHNMGFIGIPHLWPAVKDLWQSVEADWSNDDCSLHAFLWWMAQWLNRQDHPKLIAN